MASVPSKSGFSLVEALLASAMLGVVLVPALLAFHAHLSALTRMRQTLAVELTRENLQADAERRILLTEKEPAGSVDVSGPVKTVVSPPSSTPCGETRLFRMEISAEDTAAGISRGCLLYAIPPNQTLAGMSSPRPSM